MMDDMKTFKAGNEMELLDTFHLDDKLLPYPLKKVPSKHFGTVTYYDIPKSEKAMILKKMYPFWDVPKMNDIKLDIHENATFRVADYMLVRENNRNYLASPYYPVSGGMVIDWVDLGRARAFDSECPKEKYGTTKMGHPYCGTSEIFNMPENERKEFLKMVFEEYGTFRENALFFDNEARKSFRWSEFLIEAAEDGKCLVSPFYDDYFTKYDDCSPIEECFCNRETLEVDNAMDILRPLPYKLDIICDCAEGDDSEGKEIGFKINASSDDTEPIVQRSDSKGHEIHAYDIPEAEKRAVLERLFPFRPIPEYDGDVVDEAECKPFKFSECLIVRKNGVNRILTKFFNDVTAISFEK